MHSVVLGIHPICEHFDGIFTKIVIGHLLGLHVLYLFPLFVFNLAEIGELLKGLAKVVSHN